MSQRGQVAVDEDDDGERTIVAIESSRCQVALLLERGADVGEVRDLLEDAESEATWFAKGGQR